MNSRAGSVPLYHLAGWDVDPASNELTRNGETVHLENKTMAVLLALIEARGGVVSNDELIESVWEGRPLGDNPVYKAIANLRKALEDDPRNPEIIQTIARKGYRLLERVEEVSPEATRGIRWQPVLAASFALLLSVAMILFFRVDMSPAGESSIAVLPFTTQLDGEENHLIGHGIASEVLNRLAQAEGLRVVARQSSFRAFTDSSIGAIASQLKVNFVLSGYVQQVGDSLRVSTELTREDGSLVWARNFDGTGSMTFHQQDGIADAVVVDVIPEVGGSLPDRPVPDLDARAYTEYLRGVDFMDRRLLRWHPRAREALQNAIDIEPSFAAAHSNLAKVFLLGGAEEHRRESLATASIQRALELDPYDADAYAARGLMIMRRGTAADYEEAVGLFRRALSLNSSIVDARNWLSISLHVLGRREEANQVLREAIRIDPLNPMLQLNLGRRLQEEGRYDAARQQFVNASKLPDSPGYTWDWLSQLETGIGDYVAAIGWLKEGVAQQQLGNDASNWHASIIAANYMQLMMVEEAERWFATMAIPPSSRWWLEGQLNFLVPQQRFAEFSDRIEQFKAAQSTADDITRGSISMFGVHAARTGDCSAAIELLSTLFPEDWSLRNEPGGSSSLFDTLNILVWCHQQLGQVEQAERLMRDGARRRANYAQNRFSSTGRFLLTQTLALHLQGDDEDAVAKFDEAVAAGWRGLYGIRHEPWWQGLLADARIADAIKRVTDDLESQRERLRAKERQEPFLPDQMLPAS